MKTKFYFLTIVFIISIVTVGCKKANADIVTKEIDLYSNEHIEQNESEDNGSEIELGTYTFGPIGEDRYTYEGQEVHMPYEAQCLSDIPVEFGLVLYVNGYPQEYTIEGLKENRDMKNIQVISLEANQKVEFEIVFQPIEGEIGEVIGVCPVSIFNPNYLPTDLIAPNFGVFQAMSGCSAKELTIKATVEKDSISAANCIEADINEEILEELGKVGSDTSYLDNNVMVDILQNNEDVSPKLQKLETQDGKLDFTYRIMGGPNGLKFRSVIYVNNEPIEISGNKVIETTILTGKMYSIDISLDIERYNDINSIYAVAIPFDDSYMARIYYPIKTRSFIFFDENLIDEQTSSSGILNIENFMTESSNIDSVTNILYNREDSKLVLFDWKSGEEKIKIEFEQNELVVNTFKLEQGFGVFSYVLPEDKSRQSSGEMVQIPKDSNQQLRIFNNSLESQSVLNIDEILPNDIKSTMCRMSVTDDGKDLWIAYNQSLYKISIEDEEIMKIFNDKNPKNINFDNIKISKDKKKIAFFGYINDILNYGFIDVESKEIYCVEEKEYYNASDIYFTNDRMVVADDIDPMTNMTSGNMLIYDVDLKTGKRLLTKKLFAPSVSLSNDGLCLTIVDDKNDGSLEVRQYDLKMNTLINEDTVHYEGKHMNVKFIEQSDDSLKLYIVGYIDGKESVIEY